MNNLNDPPECNITPNKRGDGGSNLWTYAPFVPLLGLAAYRWFRDRESQRKVQQTKDQYDKDMKKLERKHQEILIDNRRKVAHLELELKKERHHVQQAMESLKDKDWEIEAITLLNELEQGLMERQDAYCSQIFPYDQRMQMEKNLLDKVAKKPLAQTLNMENDLKDIFLKDWHCAEFMNRDRRRNGSLMWVYLNNWKQRVAQQKEQKRVKRLMAAPQPDQDPAGSRTKT
ncbi:coiled-coil domain-containing protein 127-like isoform X2 [Brienomyrus brachyistius]|uniref:coiled-coil domain-containing protein 127-like isoform X2 n=1 Tax=Brienomyrus brachyistius TaxID=42636 RepID=UPI0020B1C2C7|nr:coiled-coil domain-containing protein 127-like isoform X2 [Brienomyrus brachyistius]XP_048880163.1 coiled-coil domain-containing protein 127-like isoform X2 [Brienomyrus brachyistius]